MSLSEAQRAIVSLQKSALNTTEGYRIDVLDRALDEIVRNYDNPSPAPWQVRSALANAGKVVRSRRDTVTAMPLHDDRLPILGTRDEELEVVELRDWLDRTRGVTSGQRELLVGLANGGDAVQLAHDQGITVQRMRERISRARAQARSAFVAEVAA